MADANSTDGRLYKIMVRDLDIAWSIGVFDHEYESFQPVRINLELLATEMADPLVDEYDEVVCYATISDHIRKMASEGHVKLVETLAHKIAMLCLEDPRVQEARVRVEKPDALKAAQSVGVEFTRTRADIGKF